jgi:hypothetical protein
MDKKSVESAVLNLVQAAATSVSPAQVRVALERQGFAGDDVRSAVARLADRGALKIDSDLKVQLKG